MQRPSRWRVSPALPAAANAALVLLWLLSAYGGWGETAFCAIADGLPADPQCLIGFAAAVEYSLILAVPALVLGLLGGVLLRDDPDALDILLTATAGLWILAEAVVFTGGYLAQP
ncbi:hypothetical protein LO762_13570 [Actinocorallia sp. API 0066]|uniref:hypothetical protein n=1 Tax=Actinocorallia sp. API 0066 TaxID=2896846 RepID=UPI001E54EC19|nr:hypothetical protein [Actinocorallia sp. API 0066]MCD0450213.1 hypothetical protein [Actinocorallia sp. API 0066]